MCLLYVVTDLAVCVYVYLRHISLMIETFYKKFIDEHSSAFSTNPI